MPGMHHEKRGVPCPLCGVRLPDISFAPDRKSDSTFFCPTCGAVWSRQDISTVCTHRAGGRRCVRAARFLCRLLGGWATRCAQHATPDGRPLILPERRKRIKPKTARRADAEDEQATIFRRINRTRRLGIETE